MQNYDVGVLTRDPKQALNQIKMITRRENGMYPKSHPFGNQRFDHHFGKVNLYKYIRLIFQNIFRKIYSSTFYLILTRLFIFIKFSA